MWQTERQGTTAMSIIYPVQRDDNLMMIITLLDSLDIVYYTKSRNDLILVLIFLSLLIVKHLPFSADSQSSQICILSPLT